MMDETAHNQVAAQEFFQRYQSAFTTRSDGSTWPKWERTERNAGRYFRGLIRPGSDKSVTDIADQMEMDQEQLERFVRKSPWEHSNVEADLRETVPQEVQGADAALIVDGMGIPKSGEKSVGVTRQWCGATGKVDNCQVTVNCTLARPGERQNADQLTYPLGMRLHLSKKWAHKDDSVYDSQQERQQYAQLREEAGVPETVEYQPKHGIAVDLIEQAVDADLDHACVVGDTNFGKRKAFRKDLRGLEESYVLEVETSKFHVVPEETEVIEPGETPGRGPARKHPAYPEEVEAETPQEVAARVEANDDWTEVSWNEGTKGTLSGEFFRERVRVVKQRQNRWVSEETGWLLVKKNHGADEDGSGGELKAWICWGLDDHSLEELVSWAQLRWTVERFHQDIKQELGADEYQGRTWKGFHHHLSAVMLAHAFIAEQRLETGVDRAELASFQEVVREIVRETAIQRLMENHGFERSQAEEVAVDMLRGFTSW